VIIGAVTAAGEAEVRLAVLRPDGTWHTIVAIIDTGFTGYLTLPSALIASLGLRPLRRGIVTLGDGSRSRGARRLIPIGAADLEPMIGMDLLHGHRLTIEVVPNGRTVIQALPVPR
jgi:predicted aspartyl protease